MELSDATRFAILCAVTMIVVRVALWYRPAPSPTIFGIRLHHWMFGAVLAPLGAFLDIVPLYAIGLGLFLDELGFLLISGRTHADNYSRASLAVWAAALLAVIIFRAQFVR